MKISIPPRDDSRLKSDKINIGIVGKTGGVNECRRAIGQLVKFGMCNITHGDFAEDVAVKVPHSKIHVIIGSGGGTIQALQTATRTKIIFPDAPNPFKKPVFVSKLHNLNNRHRFAHIYSL